MCRIVLSLVVLSCGVAYATPSAACVGWTTLQRQIKRTWAKTHPKAKISKNRRSGQARHYVKVERVRGRRVKNSYCAQSVETTVKRSNGSVATFNASWHYLKQGRGWTFHHHATGAVSEKAAPGQEAPPKAKIKQMIAASWVKDVDKTDKVRKVLITKPKKVVGKLAYNILADLYVTTKSGKNEVCKDYRVVIFKGKVVDGLSTSYGTGGGPWEAELTPKRRYSSKCKAE